MEDQDAKYKVLCLDPMLYTGHYLRAKILKHDNRSLDRYLNPVSPEYAAEVLITRPRCCLGLSFVASVKFKYQHSLAKYNLICCKNDVP